ncbi:MAG: serine/threonine protein kinase [Bacteroidetes bacterium]|nr:serine/threonine protein kinase [Bacteroidota bacterium]
MDSERWQVLKSILDGALRLPPKLRDEFVERASDDAALREEVRSLLDSYSDDPEFLEEAVASEALDAVAWKDATGRTGARVGRYELVRQIGRGGMGTVYLAERADGAYQQNVAVKLVDGIRAADTILERLRQERQILARLQHPNIARLLDGGVTEDGRPFLVMEYVDGLNIHDHCREHRLSTDARLQLFATICDAVHFAHQNLIVHRDLKPSNILIDKSGRPKLLDFGIAKLLDDDDSQLTRIGGQALTPAYASPEQIRGDSVSTASDTYSLGVILFELLTGRRPYQNVGKSATEMERAVCLTEAPKPSTIVSRSPEEYQPVESRSAVAPERLKRELAGDLDMIVLKALRKDAARRYPSAAELAADCRRHLNNQPVTARPETLSYLASTFVRRHRLGVAASVLVLLSLLGAAIGTSWQANIAAHERDRARDRFDAVYALSNTMLLDLHDTIRDLPGTTHARRMLVSQATKYLDILAAEASDTDSLSDDLAVAYERLGEIQGDPHFPNLGDMGAAKSRYQAALAIRVRHWEADSANATKTHELATILGRLAVVNSWSGDNEKAIEQSKQALRLLRSLDDSDPRIRHDEFRIQSELGWWYVYAGRMDDGLAELHAAERIAEELSTTGYSNIDFDVDRWRIYAYSADGLQFNGDADAALRLLTDKAFPMAHRVVQQHPDNPRASGLVYTSRSKTARLYEVAGRSREALQEYKILLTDTYTRVQRDTANVRARSSLAAVQHAIGEIYLTLDQPEDALEYFTLALDTRKQLLARDPSTGEYGYFVASTMRSICNLHAAADRFDEALATCEEAAQVQDRVAERDPHNLVGQSARKNIYLETARIHIRRGDRQSGTERADAYSRAIAWFDRAIRLARSLDEQGVEFDWVKDPSPIVAERQALIDRRP